MSSLPESAARRLEIAVRLALGAGRARVLRQLLIESLLLSSLAGIVSLIVSSALSTRIFGAATGALSTLNFRFENDLRVYGFVLLSTFAATLLSGLPPAIQTLRSIHPAGL